MRQLMTTVWSRVHELLETNLGGVPIMTPSSVADLKNPELRPVLDRFYRGATSSAEEKIKIFKLAWDWDTTGTEFRFSARHELYGRTTRATRTKSA